MSFTLIRSQIATLLKAVSGIGQVHEFRRHSTTWEEIYNRHKLDGRINNWEITRSATAQELDTIQGASGTEPLFQDTHSVVILGHMSLDDSKETEKTFQTLIDAIVAKLRINQILSGNVLLPRSIQVPIIEHQMFGGILVHFTELNFEAIERVGG